MGLSLQVELELAETGEQRFSLGGIAVGLGLQSGDFGVKEGDLQAQLLDD